MKKMILGFILCFVLVFYTNALKIQIIEEYENKSLIQLEFAGLVFNYEVIE